MAWAELSDVRCYYELHGDGEPLLLLCGMGNTCRQWDGAAQLLEPDFSMICPDNRGVGQSEARRPAKTLRHLASDMFELLDHLQVPRAHVMGISFGGMIAQQFAIDFPERVARLTLISCTDGFSPYLRSVSQLLGGALRRFSTTTFYRTVELLGTSPIYLDAHPETIEQRVHDKAAVAVSRTALAAQLRCLAASDIDLRTHRIAAPTLVVAGQYDALIPNCYVRQIAQRIQDSRYLVIEGAGHNPLAEMPQSSLPPIAAFLNGADDVGEKVAPETQRPAAGPTPPADPPRSVLAARMRRLRLSGALPASVEPEAQP